MGEPDQGDPWRGDPLSEQDLRLKLNTARLFWLMGSSTLLRVRLSTTEAAARGRISELTDLDVLGVTVSPDFGLRYRAAECKSSKVGAKELFWLRGVLDYFGAEDGYLVVHYDDIRRQALRELSERLRLGILTSTDFATLLPAHGEEASRADKVLFESTTVAAADQLLTTLDKSLSRLQDYTGRVFWQQPLHRNLQLAVAYLDDAAKTLAPRQRSHLLLFGELTYRYCLALFAAAESVVRRGAPNVTELLPAHLHGGERGLRDANRRLQAVKEFQKSIEAGDRLDLEGIFSPLPPYYSDLLELVTRIIRRPQQPTLMLRHLQAAIWGTLVGRVPLKEVMPDADPLTTKLLNDVVRYLVGASGIDVAFRTSFAALLDPATNAGLSGKDAQGEADSPREPADRLAGGRVGAQGSSPRAGRKSDAVAEEQESLPVEETGA